MFTKEDCEGVVRHYRDAYWYRNAEAAEAVFWCLWADNKIDQPRCRGEEAPSRLLRYGRWNFELPENIDELE